MTVEQAIKSLHTLAITTKSVINIMYTSRYIEEAVNKVLKPHDLSIPQYNVLRILRGQKGNPASLSVIQERMIDKSSNTTRLVDKLVNKGWVDRCICEQNRRKVEIRITDAGLALLKILDPLTEKNNERIVEHINTEQLIAMNETLDLIRNPKQ